MSVDALLGTTANSMAGTVQNLAIPSTPSDIERASRWIVHREFSEFERHIFAMKRLCDEGELALSLIGTD